MSSIGLGPGGQQSASFPNCGSVRPDGTIGNGLTRSRWARKPASAELLGFSGVNSPRRLCADDRLLGAGTHAASVQSSVRRVDRQAWGLSSAPCLHAFLIQGFSSSMGLLKWADVARLHRPGHRLWVQSSVTCHCPTGVLAGETGHSHPPTRRPLGPGSVCPEQLQDAACSEHRELDFGGSLGSGNRPPSPALEAQTAHTSFSNFPNELPFALEKSPPNRVRKKHF